MPFRGGSGWSAGGLVVEGELAEQFAGGGVDDADLEVLDEQQDVGSGAGSADAGAGLARRAAVHVSALIVNLVTPAFAFVTALDVVRQQPME